MYNHLHSIPACDRRTSSDVIVRAMHMRHAVKIVEKRTVEDINCYL